MYLLKRGDRNDKVRQVQILLRKKGFMAVESSGFFGIDTQSAVQRLYRAYGHLGNDHVGDTMWEILLGEHPWTVLSITEREASAELLARRRIAARSGGWDKIDPSHLRAAEYFKNWLELRSKELHDLAQETGWDRAHRRARHKILHEVI